MTLEKKLSAFIVVEERLAVSEAERSEVGVRLAAVQAECESLEKKLAAGSVAEQRLEAAEAGRLEAGERLAAVELERAALEVKLAAMSEVAERLSAAKIELAAVEAERAALEMKLLSAEAGGGAAAAEANAQTYALKEARMALEEERAEAVRRGGELAGGIEQAVLVCEAFETQLGTLSDWVQVYLPGGDQPALLIASQDQSFELASLITHRVLSL